MKRDEANERMNDRGCGRGRQNNMQFYREVIRGIAGEDSEGSLTSFVPRQRPFWRDVAPQVPAAPDPYPPAAWPSATLRKERGSKDETGITGCRSSSRTQLLAMLLNHILRG